MNIPRSFSALLDEVARATRGVIAVGVFLCGVGQATAQTNTPPVTSGTTYKTTLPQHVEVRLDLLTKDATPTARGLTYACTAPLNGTLTQFFFYGSAWPGFFVYTPNAGFTGTETLRFSASDGQFVSNESIVTIEVSSNVKPQLLGGSNWVTAGQTTPGRVQIGGVGRLIDPDNSQVFTYEISKPPTRGKCSSLTTSLNGSRWGCTFEYTPDAGFVGEDFFEARVYDGSEWSDPARCRIVVREAGKPAGALVLIVVEGALASELAPELQRMKADMEAEGWSARIVSWTQDARALWDYARAEYLKTDQCLVGAVLIGNVPTPGSPHNLWQLWKYRTNWYCRPNGETGPSSTTSDSGIDIWVSRLKAPDSWYLRNALEANHRYRAGQSRVQQRQWRYVGPEWGDNVTSPANLRKVWSSEVFQRSMWEGLSQGAEYLIMFDHDGGGDGEEGNVSMPGTPIQARFYTDDGCAAGARRARSAIYSRGGSNVFTGGNAATWGGGGTWGDNLLGSAAKVDAFTRGVAFGSIVMGEQRSGFPFYANSYHVWGDLSLAYKNTGNNLQPAATLVGPKSFVRVGEPVTFTVTANDPDAAVTDNPGLDYKLLGEFWPTGFGDDNQPQSRGGRREPAHARTYAQGAVTDTFTATYDRPHWYQVRFETQDEWSLRYTVETQVVVTPELGQPIRVDCGNMGTDVVDSKGQLWLFDQTWVSGTWGVKVPWGQCTDLRSVVPISNTTDATIFQTCRSFGGMMMYQIPVRNGTYQVKLGFADFLSRAAGEAVTDVSIEGAQVLDDFDAFASAGWRTAVVKTFTVKVADGQLDISGTRVGKYDSFLNNIEVIPVSGFQTWIDAKVSVSPNAGMFPSSVLTEAADADGDGLANLLEYALDLDPLTPAPPPAGVYAVSAQPADGFALTFLRTREELTYAVEFSTDLTTWTTVATNPGTVGALVTVPAPASDAARRFLRLRVTSL